jgi:GNAT superfamily N-acetyltransferase
MWEDGADAWYICRFAVARSFARQGVGGLALAGVEQDAKDAGVQALRLDVTADNPFLSSYYANRGFQIQETVRIFGEPMALLQKALERAP